MGSGEYNCDIVIRGINVIYTGLGQNGGTNCPACRSISTSVTPSRILQSMIDLLLRADPSKARTDIDKAQADEVYKAGNTLVVNQIFPLSFISLLIHIVNSFLSHNPLVQNRISKLPTIISLAPVQPVHLTISMTGNVQILFMILQMALNRHLILTTVHHRDMHSAEIVINCTTLKLLILPNVIFARFRFAE